MNFGKLGSCLKRLFISDKAPKTHVNWKEASVLLTRIEVQLRSTDEVLISAALKELSSLVIAPSSVKRSNYNQSVYLLESILKPLAKKYIQNPENPESIEIMDAMTSLYQNNKNVLSFGGAIANDFYYDYRLPDSFRDVVTESMNHSRNNAGAASSPVMSRENWIRKEGLSFLEGLGKKDLSPEDASTADSVQRLFASEKDETKKKFFNQLTGREKMDEDDRSLIIDTVKIDSAWKAEELLYLLGYTFNNDLGALYYHHPTEKNKIVIFKKNYQLHGNFTEEDIAKLIRSLKDRTDCTISLN